MSTVVQCKDAATPPPAPSKSFCIEALLARGGTAEDASARGSDEGSPRSLSPAISPGCEMQQIAGHSQSQYAPLQGTGTLVPRPGVLGGPLLHAGLYGFPHLLQSGSASAFHPLDGTKMGGAAAGGSPNGGQNPAAAPQQFHPMQLEWLARTGMFYPRLPDLTGQCIPSF